jgi:hypothetical protein
MRNTMARGAEQCRHGRSDSFIAASGKFISLVVEDVATVARVPTPLRGLPLGAVPLLAIVQPRL